MAFFPFYATTVLLQRKQRICLRLHPVRRKHPLQQLLGSSLDKLYSSGSGAALPSSLLPLYPYKCELSPAELKTKPGQLLYRSLLPLEEKPPQSTLPVPAVCLRRQPPHLRPHVSPHTNSSPRRCYFQLCSTEAALVSSSASLHTALTSPRGSAPRQTGALGRMVTRQPSVYQGILLPAQRLFSKSSENSK